MWAPSAVRAAKKGEVRDLSSWSKRPKEPNRRTPKAATFAVVAVAVLLFGAVAAVAGVTPIGVLHAFTTRTATTVATHDATAPKLSAAHLQKIGGARTHGHKAPAAIAKKGHALPRILAGAVGTASGFEDDDGNLTHETATDWNDFGPLSWSGTAPNQSATATANGWSFLGLTDAEVSSSDTAFKSGTKQDASCPILTPSSAPNKDDLARIYLATHTGSNPAHVYLTLAWERIKQNTPSADAHVAFEFHQGSAACANGDGLVQRTEGDLLLFYDFQSGSASISASTWDATNNVWRTATTVSADAEVNTADTTDNIAPGAPVTLGALEFGEAGLDLTQTFVNLSHGTAGRACETFGNLYAESRSSGSSDQANMEDLVGPANVHVSTCVTPTISTTPNPGSGSLGTHLNDTANITGGNGPTGSVTFNLYPPSDSTCQGTPLYTESNVPLSNGSAATQNGPAAATAGTYHWTATYNGDGNNNAVTSGCADEAVTIAKATPTLTTNASGPVLVGAAIHDTAHLGGGSSPTGTVSFQVFAPGDTSCQTPLTPAPTSATVSGAADYNSGDFTTTAAGTYRWIAHYSGDANNNAVDTACNDANEASTVNKATPTLSTTASGPVTVGAAIHDTAHLGGGFGTLGGTVSFQVFAPGDTTCQTPLTPAPTSATVSGAADYDSGSITADNAGDYRWIAHYSGDANNNAVDTSCNDANESSAVGKASPSIVTSLSSATGAIGDKVHDSSTLSGASAGAGGTATYTVYTNDTCTTAATSAQIDGQPSAVAVTAGKVADSPDVKFLQAGDYYWRVVYSGDGNNNGASSPCNAEDNEHLAIAKNTPTISTKLSSSETLAGSSVNDSASLSGATADAGGTVTYTVFTSAECVDGQTVGEPVTVDAGQVPNSNGMAFPNAGTYYWQASYSGDDNNAAATSPCTDEVLQVDSPSISITKNPKSQSIDSGGTAHFTISVTNTGSVTLSNVQVTDLLAPGCAKAIGTLTPGQSTSYDCALSALTASFTNSATAIGTPPVGPDVTATDTAPVTVNAIPPPPPPPPPPPTIDLGITKVGTPSPSTLGGNITWTLTVVNNGPSKATGVTVADAIPAGTTFVSATSTQGTCTGGAALNCQIGAMNVGQTVTVTLLTTSTATGTIPNTATVVGNEAETNTANNTASASVQVVGPFKPPVNYCTALIVSPKQLVVGKKHTLTIKVSQHGKAIRGIKVRIKGATLSVTTSASNSKGVVKRAVKPTKAGIVTFVPVAHKGCSHPRVGVIGVFTPPVTG